MNNPLSQVRQNPTSRTFESLQDWADYQNDGFIAAQYRWFWYVTDGRNGLKLSKFDMNRLGTIGYVQEKPDRAKAYISKVVEGDADLIDEIYALATGKPRPAIIREKAA